MKQSIDYNTWIGETIIKRSNRPFSSGEKAEVVTGLTKNPFSNKIAFELEDSKLVDCYQCRLLNSYNGIFLDSNIHINYADDRIMMITKEHKTQRFISLDIEFSRDDDQNLFFVHASVSINLTGIKPNYYKEKEYSSEHDFLDKDNMSEFEKGFLLKKILPIQGEQSDIDESYKDLLSALTSGDIKSIKGIIKDEVGLEVTLDHGDSLCILGSVRESSVIHCRDESII
jgi:hypothetical protein